MAQTASVPPIVTQTFKFVLRSPLHGLVDKNILLITFTGRKSGKTFTTPVSYSQHGAEVYIFTHANWWKNLRRDTPVTLRLRGRDVKGLPEPVAEDKQAVAAGLAEHLRVVPSDATFYGVTFDERRNPNAEQVARAVQSVVMIRVRPC